MADRMDIIARNGNDGEHYEQIGGSHYKLPIEPIDFIVKNDIPFREANVVKYVVRYKNKNGLEDLLKAQHYLQMIIEDYNAN